MTPTQESLWETIKGDFRGATGLKLLGVAALLAWMAFQWGFGNDAILPSIVAWVIDAIDDADSWSTGATAVGAATLAGFAFWGATQAFDAVITLAGVRLIPGTINRLSAFLQRKGWVRPYAEMKWSTRWIIAYATGVSALCLVDLFATGNEGVRHRRKMIMVATALSAGSVAAVVAVISTAAIVAKRIPATERSADTLIRFAKNPLTWIVIFSTVFLIGHLRSQRATASQ